MTSVSTSRPYLKTVPSKFISFSVQTWNAGDLIFTYLFGQSCSHGEHIKCSPARTELNASKYQIPRSRFDYKKANVSISDKTFPRRGSIWPHSAVQQPLPWQTCHIRPHRSRVLGVSSAASSARAGGHLMWPPCEPGLSEAPDETPKAPTAPTGQTASKYAPPQQKRQQQPARPDRPRTWGRPCGRQSFGWS